MFRLLLSLLVLLMPLCSVQVNNIECLPNNQVKVSFNVEGVDSTAKVKFTLNDVNLTAVRESNTLFTKIVSVTFPYTGTISSAYLVFNGNKYYAGNVPYTKVLSCSPTSVTNLSFSAQSVSDTGHALIIFLVIVILGLGLAVYIGGKHGQV